MKKLFYLVVALSLFITSCSDEDTIEEFENNGNVVGTWSFQGVTADVATSDATLSLVVNPLLETALKKYAESQELTYYVFNEDGAYESYIAEISESAKVGYGTYTLGEATLTLIDETSSETVVFDIIVANESSLKIRKDYSGSTAYWATSIVGEYVGITVSSAIATLTYIKE